MKYCLDTNTLIYFFKGLGDVSNRLLATGPRDATCAIESLIEGTTDSGGCVTLGA